MPVVKFLLRLITGDRGRVIQAIKSRAGTLIGVVDPRQDDPAGRPPVDLEKYRLERRPVDFNNRLNKARKQ